jgi:hypothetical protein
MFGKSHRQIDVVLKKAIMPHRGMIIAFGFCVKLTRAWLQESYIEIY